MRSATAPETIVAAVAQKTICQKKSSCLSGVPMSPVRKSEPVPNRPLWSAPFITA